MRATYQLNKEKLDYNYRKHQHEFQGYFACINRMITTADSHDDTTNTECSVRKTWRTARRCSNRNESSPGSRSRYLPSPIMLSRPNVDCRRNDVETRHTKLVKFDSIRDVTNPFWNPAQESLSQISLFCQQATAPILVLQVSNLKNKYKQSNALYQQRNAELTSEYRKVRSVNL